jgi:hypothetical protein
LPIYLIVSTVPWCIFWLVNWPSFPHRIYCRERHRCILFFTKKTALLYQSCLDVSLMNKQLAWGGFYKKPTRKERANRFF